MMSPKISVVVSLLVAMSLVGSHLHARVVDPSAGKAALLVGVNTYQDAKMKPLRYSEADAAEIAEVLRASGYKVTLLLGKEATQAAVQRELTAIQKLGTKDGVLLLGFFGHGVQYDDLAHFCPYNATLRAVRDKDNNILRDDKTRLPLQEPDPQSLVSMRDMIDTLALSPAGSKLLLADCCREDPNAARGLLTGRGAFGSSLRVDQLPKNCAALFACSDGEQAFEHEDWKHGAFTKALLESLRSGKRITANGLSESVYDGVEKLVTSKGQRQTVNSFLTGGLIDLKLKLNPIMASDISKSKSQNTPAEPATPAGARSFVNSVGATMVLIPAGSFEMGSNETKAQLEAAGFTVSFDVDQESPRHSVCISKPFYLGATEVTVGQFRQFVNATGYKTEAESLGKGGVGYDPRTTASEQNPVFSWKNTGFSQGDDHPVVNISWNDADAYCQWLSNKDGRKYRLPSEAEWEYSCRGGRITRYHCGDTPVSLKGYGNFQDKSFERKIPKEDFVQNPSIQFDDGFAFTAPVGRFSANPFGLYDMHGNVWEWCADWYDAEYYAGSPGIDPVGPVTGSCRVFRGGCWGNSTVSVRAAFRLGETPDNQCYNLGFRVASSLIP